MKKYKQTILTLFVVLASGFFTSCNFLNVDSYFLDTMKEDSIFHTKANAEGYLWNTPTLFPEAGMIWGSPYAPGELASDEITARWRTNEYPGTAFTVGEINSYNIGNTSMGRIWGRMYKVINRANEMLAKVDAVPGMTRSEIAEYKGYVHFIRGYAYYLLLQNWGPLLIVGDEIIDVSKPAEDFNRQRATYDESVDYIVNEFEMAAKAIPAQDRMPLSVYGRPSSGAALALAARVRLIQASPLFNGGDAARKYYGNFTKTDEATKQKVHYVSQVYNPKRWAQAAHAAKRVIDLELYELHTVARYDLTPKLPANVKQDGYISARATAGSIDPYHSYKDMFSGETLAKFNKEFIWAEEFSSGVRSYITHSFPRNLGGWGGMSVPQKVVDRYYMRDGNTIENSSKEYPYEVDPKKRARKIDRFSGYTVMTASVPAMYHNREMRFYANIGFSGAYWLLNSATSKKYSSQQVFYSAEADGGKSGAGKNENDYTSTGYVPVKYIHQDDALKDDDKNNVVISKPFPIIRYAEILLAYAEALNEIDGSITVEEVDEYGSKNQKTYSRDAAEILKYFNMVRYRAGLPGLEVLPSKEEMRELIKRERSIEFFNENQRFYDIRRWGDYEKEDAGSTFTGLNVEGERILFYQIVNVDTQVIRDRVTDRKMVWLPIDHYELIKVPKMDQNPGWDK